MKYFQSLQRKSNFVQSTSNHACKFIKDCKEKCKTKVIKQAYSSYSNMFRHIQTYASVSRHIQKLFRHIQAYPELCVTLAYSEPPYIQKAFILRTRDIFKLWYIQNQRHVQNPDVFRTIRNIHNGAFCGNTFMNFYFINIMNFFSTCLIFTPNIFLIHLNRIS